MIDSLAGPYFPNHLEGQDEHIELTYKYRFHAMLSSARKAGSEWGSQPFV